MCGKSRETCACASYDIQQIKSINIHGTVVCDVDVTDVQMNMLPLS